MNPEDIRRIWNKAVEVSGYNSDMVRKDACGAWIVFSQFGDRNKPYGWEIDHVMPVSLLVEKGIPRESMSVDDNLRPLHWMNNASKGNKYPSYIAVVEAEGDKNKYVEKAFSVNANLQNRLNKIFGIKSC